MFTKLKLPTDSGFSIWFDKKEKTEYYVTPVYSYKINKVKSIYNNHLTIKLASDWKDKSVSCYSMSYRNPYVERYGRLLLNFLNADFSSAVTAYETFFAFYGIELLQGYLLDKINIRKVFNKGNQFFKAFELLYSECQEKINEFQELIRECVIYTYNLKDNTEHSEYTQLERFTSFALRKELFAYSSYTDIYFNNLIGYDRDLSRLVNNKVSEISKKMKKNLISLKISNIYHSTFLSNIVFFSLYEIVTNERVIIKNCENCGKYFIPTTKQTEIYCDLTYYENERSCRDTGAGKRYKRNIDEVEGYIIYRRTYQKTLMYLKRNPNMIGDTKTRFKQWKQKSQAKIKDFKNGLLTEEELNIWMRKNKDL